MRMEDVDARRIRWLDFEMLHDRPDALPRVRTLGGDVAELA